MIYIVHLHQKYTVAFTAVSAQKTELRYYILDIGKRVLSMPLKMQFM